MVSWGRSPVEFLLNIHVYLDESGGFLQNFMGTIKIM